MDLSTESTEGYATWIKQGFGPKGSKPSLDECIQYIFHLVLQVQRDINQETLGKRTRYGKKTNPIERSAAKIKKRKAKKYINDGRPPDTTDTLISRSKTRKISLGARKQGGVGSRPRKAPSSNDLVGLMDAIPWSYEKDGIKVTNTCPLDSPLMMMFLMRKHGSLSQSIFQSDVKLTEVLNLIDIGFPNY